MTSKITPSCKAFTASIACKSFHTPITVLPRTAGVIRTIFTLIVWLLLLHDYILEGSLHVICWQHRHLLLQLGDRIVAHTLSHVMLELPLGGSGNSSRAFSIQDIRDIHTWIWSGGPIRNCSGGASSSTASSECITFVNLLTGSDCRIGRHLDQESVLRIVTKFVGILPCSRGSDLQHAQR